MPYDGHVTILPAIPGLADIRVKLQRRIITIEIIDHTPIPFSALDLEWIGDAVEDVLQQRYNVTVDVVDVKSPSC